LTPGRMAQENKDKAGKYLPKGSSGEDLLAQNPGGYGEIFLRQMSNFVRAVKYSTPYKAQIEDFLYTFYGVDVSQIDENNLSEDDRKNLAKILLDPELRVMSNDTLDLFECAARLRARALRDPEFAARVKKGGFDPFFPEKKHLAFMLSRPDNAEALCREVNGRYLRGAEPMEPAATLKQKKKEDKNDNKGPAAPGGAVILAAGLLSAKKKKSKNKKDGNEEKDSLGGIAFDGDSVTIKAGGDVFFEVSAAAEEIFRQSGDIGYTVLSLRSHGSFL